MVLDKYKDHLQRARRDRSRQSSPSNISNGLTSVDYSQPSSYDQSQPRSYDQSKPITHDRTWPRTRDLSSPNSLASLNQNGTSWNNLPLSSSSQDVNPKAGYFEGPVKGLDTDVRAKSRPDLVTSSSK